MLDYCEHLAKKIAKKHCNTIVGERESDEN